MRIDPLDDLAVGRRLQAFPTGSGVLPCNQPTCFRSVSTSNRWKASTAGKSLLAIR